MPEWIGAAEAAERLGIKPASLYAYVSRGALGRLRDPAGRGSLFDADEVARLGRKGRPRRAPAGAELLIESALTEITGTHFRYRGRDVTELAAFSSFEAVAGLLWTGSLDAVPENGQRGNGQPWERRAEDGRSEDVWPEDRWPVDDWRATDAALAAGRAAQAALPPSTLPLERLQVIVPALAATDPLRLHLDRAAVIAAGRALIAGMVGCLPPAPGATPAPDGETTSEAAGPLAGGTGGQPTAAEGPGSIAGRLTAVLCPGVPPAGLVATV